MTTKRERAEAALGLLDEWMHTPADPDDWSGDIGHPVCPFCRDSETWPVSATWTVRLDYAIPSQNRAIGKGGARVSMAARKRYERQRDALVAHFRAFDGLRLFKGCCHADGPRRMVITRLMGKRQRRYDHANLVGGAKMLVDALVRAGWLVDDDDESLRGHYHQRRSDDGKPGTIIEISAFVGGIPDVQDADPVKAWDRWYAENDQGWSEVDDIEAELGRESLKKDSV